MSTRNYTSLEYSFIISWIISAALPVVAKNVKLDGTTAETVCVQKT